MKKSFADLKSPVLTLSARERNVTETIASIRNAMLAGADAFNLHLSWLDKDEITIDKLKTIFEFTDKPILALHYNQGASTDDSDEERIRQFMIALDAGAAGVDMQGYTFEPNRDAKATFKKAWIGDNMSFVLACPNEVSLNPQTIEKQKDFISIVHAKGGEVLLSTHTGCFLDCKQVVDLLDFIHERKPDIIKLVTAECDTGGQLAEYYKTMLYIKNRYSDCKISYHCNGKMTKYTRIIGPMLGSHIAFCVDRYTASSAIEMIPLAEASTIYRLFEKNVI